jgi:hypothetical protein
MIEFNRSGYTLSKRSIGATGIKGKVPPTSPIVLKLIDAIMHCVAGVNGTSSSKFSVSSHNV